jgi:hypothetical protein
VAGAEIAREIERTRALADRTGALLVGLTDEQLLRRPAPGRWSVGECLAHVNRTNRLYLERIEPAVREARARGKLAEGPFRYGRLEEWFVRELSPPVRRRFKAPGVFVPPPAEVDAEAVRRDVLALLERLEAALREADGVDLAAVKVASPVSGLLKFRLGPAFRLLTGHTERHLIQAQGARRAILKEAS